MIYLFNFLVIELKTTLKFLIQEKKKQLKSSYQETYENVSQVRPQENTQEIATSPYGGILISRLHLILPSVSPIMITRLCSSLFMALVKSNSYFDRNLDFFLKN